MYQIHLRHHKKTTNYPKVDILELVEKELFSVHSFHSTAVISISSPMVKFCFKETFSFQRRRVKKNPFAFPLVIEGHGFDSASFHAIVHSLHKEYELLWRSTFRGTVQPAFS
jgi:hypothetical protein